MQVNINNLFRATKLICSGLRVAFGNLRETIKISEVVGSSLVHSCNLSAVAFDSSSE